MEIIMEDKVLFGYKTEPIYISIPNSKQLIQRGLKYFLGENAKWIPEYDEISEWLRDNNGKGLLLIGDSGRGKTFIADKILTPIIKNSFYSSNFDVVFVMGYSMLEDYERGSGRMYIVDDVGVEREQSVYGERINAFNKIIYESELFKRLLIITTNLTIKELEEKYGERTIDRLRSLTKPVVFRGKSFRV